MEARSARHHTQWLWQGKEQNQGVGASRERRCRWFQRNCV